MGCVDGCVDGCLQGWCLHEAHADIAKHSCRSCCSLHSPRLAAVVAVARLGGACGRVGALAGPVANLGIVERGGWENDGGKVLSNVVVGTTTGERLNLQLGNTATALGATT